MIQKFQRHRPFPHILFFAGAYLASIAFLAISGNFPVENIIGVLLLFGVGFTAIAWLLTRKTEPLLPTKPFDNREWIWLTLLMLAVSGVLAVGFSNPGLPESSRLSQLLVLVKKPGLFFVLPYLVYRWRFSYTLRDFGFLKWREIFRKQDVITFIVLGALVLVFTWFASRQAAPFRNGEFPATTLLLGLPTVFLWLLLEVGLTEEFFFRALLQDRLTVALGSKTGGILWSGLLFALAHVPGVWLRGSGSLEGLPPDAGLLTCIAYCIPVMGLAGIFLGIVWARTRNFWLVAGIHALVDLLSNFKEVMVPG
jgi:membrane protease YdiL (CAAX protease family)